MSAERVDAAWLRAHPLPSVESGKDKDERGRALIVGGSAFVPGAIRLTGEAVLRAGAGKVQLATIEAAAIALGVLFPEAAMIALPAEEGEIAGGAASVLEDRLDRSDALILGPGMIERDQTRTFVEAVLAAADPETPILLDAGAMTAACRGTLAGRPLVMTPHHGELATMLGIDKEEVEADPAAVALQAAKRFGAVVAAKDAETFIAGPDGALLHYVSESPGLGTAGSGDVLSGVIGGLLARGVEPLVATAWGVWLHGESGKVAAAKVGPLGFLARELPGEIPALIASLAD